MTVNWKIEVNNALKRFGIAADLTHEQCLEYIVILYDECNWSLKGISNHFFNNNVSWYTVRELLITCGVQLKSKGGPNHCKYKEIPIEDLCSLTLAECAEKHNVSKSTIQKARREHGVSKVQK